MDVLLYPRSVAVLGASTKRMSRGNTVLRNLQRHGFEGSLVAIHPESAEIDGVMAVARPDQVSFPLDLAMVALPSDRIVDTLNDLAAIDCKAAIVLSAGVSSEDKRAISDLASKSGMLVQGPNCMGLTNSITGVPFWFYPGPPLEKAPGDIALIAQSGSATVALPLTTRGVGYSYIVSTGDEVSVSTADYLAWLATDPHTVAAGIVVESIADPESFAAGVKAMHEAEKPVVALKVGWTSSGKAATTSHTGAIIGSGQAYVQFFKSLDLPLVSDYDGLAAALECFARPLTRHAAGVSVGIIAMSGGQAGLAADLAETSRLSIAKYSETTHAVLDDLLPGVSVYNPVDIGVAPKRGKGIEPTLISTIARDGNVDTVLLVIDAQDRHRDDQLEFQDITVAAVNEVLDRWDETELPLKPFLVASSSATAIHAGLRERLDPRVPIIPGITNAIVAARVIAHNQPKRDWADDSSAGHSDVPITPASEAKRRTVLSMEHAIHLLRVNGIEVLNTVVATGDDAARAAGELGYPIVAKVSSPDLPHRSDVGGVRVGIKNRDELMDALRDMRQSVTAVAPDAEILGFELQPYIPNCLEAMVGFVPDAVFGSMVSVGLGGTLVEILGDAAVAPMPIDIEAATSLINSTRLGRLLGGYRNLYPCTPTRPLAALLVSFAALARQNDMNVVEGDLNPVLIQPGTGRVWVADALLLAEAER